MDINLITPINQLGYGIAGLNILKALVSNGHKTYLNVIGPGNASVTDMPIIDEAKDRIKINKYAPSVRIWHASDLSLHIGKGLHCGFPIFELNSFTDKELYLLQLMDAVFVCSKWAKEIVDYAIVWPRCYVVPLGVDRSIFNEYLPSNPHSETVFFNCGKWEIRKGHDILVEAFNKAFSADDDVRLIMNCWSPFLNEKDNEAWATKYTRSKLGKQGKIIIKRGRLNTQQDLARLMINVDCGVFPVRAEGWNLEALELLSMGKYVIATNYSAHTEYLTQDNAKLIHIDKLERANDGIWFKNEGEWAAFGDNQMEQLIMHLRDIHKAKQALQLEVNVKGIQTAKTFSWDETVKQMIKAIEHAGNPRP